MLSVVIPAFNEEKMIPLIAREVGGVLFDARIDCEIIFVDDGSKDKTWRNIKALSKANEMIVGVHLSRNFGKESAMFAGLEVARGDAVVVMDADLQHPPEKIVEMYELWQEGFEVIEGVKNDRGEETKLKKKISEYFYKLMSKSSGFDMTGTSDFKLLDRKVVDTLNALPERNVFFRALSFWAGYKHTTVKYSVDRRRVGNSKWSKKALVSYAINNIMSFTSAPLQIVTILGVVTLVISLVMSIVAIVQKIMGSALGGFTTVIILLLLIGSIIMISLGIIGSYIAKIYDEVKGRPKFIISEITNRE